MTDSLADALEEKHQRSGLSFKDLEREVYKRLGPTAPTQVTIRKYHHPALIPQMYSLDLVAALADIYGVTLAELWPEAEDRRRRVNALSRGHNRRQGPTVPIMSSRHLATAS